MNDLITILTVLESYGLKVDELLKNVTYQDCDHVVIEVDDVKVIMTLDLIKLQK